MTSTLRLVLAIFLWAAAAQAQPVGAKADTRMDWWREARFGMFIHWGLYAVPAGEWEGKTGYGEWIMNHAKIPVEEYEKLQQQFNPTRFDAAKIVRAAKNAGMKYIVITTKHHDGFALFDSKVSNYDVMSTPFQRDIMKELAQACRREGIRICWYHSIMDWHHPDYTPRRDWETRSADGADFDRYVQYMKAQLKELLTNYGPIGVLWFDGQWEGTWNDERGRDLYQFVRGLQPRIIVNNRVGRAGGDFGLNKEQGRAGDFGTPEQEIPAVGIPGADWETCMTMNDHWGYNRADKHFKTTEDLIRKLADIASKGGNFLLNVGPTADGEIPTESIQRLEEIGTWMKVNEGSIHGTQASPFPKLDWGRCTQRGLPGGGTRLYLHVFDWPTHRELIVPGILNTPRGAFLLSDASKAHLSVHRSEDAIVVTVPDRAPDAIDSVVVLDIDGKPDITVAPTIKAEAEVFVGETEVSIWSDRERVDLRYTLDGSEPTADSDLVTGPIKIDKTSTVSARAFRGPKAVSPAASLMFTRVQPQAAEEAGPVEPGLSFDYFTGEFKACEAVEKATPALQSETAGFDLSAHGEDTKFGFVFRGYVRIPKDGAYRFITRSDDGSRLWIGDTLVVDNDKPHSMHEESGVVALAAGLHPVKLTFFESGGGFGLEVLWSAPGMPRQPIPAEALVHKK